MKKLVLIIGLFSLVSMGLFAQTDSLTIKKYELYKNVFSQKKITRSKVRIYFEFPVVHHRTIVANSVLKKIGVPQTDVIDEITPVFFVKDRAEEAVIQGTVIEVYDVGVVINNDDAVEIYHSADREDDVIEFFHFLVPYDQIVSISYY